MRLLLTRAAEDAARTRAKLEADGHRVIVSPVIEIVGTGATWPDGVIDAVIATSGQAFGAIHGRERPTPEARRLMPLWLVGERTATLARRHGFAGPTTVTANVATLAIALGKQTPFPMRCLYLAARDRKPDIETALDVIGCRPEVLEVYEARALADMTLEAADALAAGLVRAVLHFSRRSAALFLAQADRAGRDVRPLVHHCLSDDVATPLREAGCDKLEIADEPREEALLASIEPR